MATGTIKRQPFIQSGKIQHKNFTLATWGGESGSYGTVTFNNQFSTAPVVCVTVESRNTGAYGVINVEVANISASGFDIYTDVSTATVDVFYDWIAIEQ